MGRKAKYPDHEQEAKQLMNELLDEVADAWNSEDEPELKTIAEEVGISAAKLRKLLITAGERDHATYFDSPVAMQIVRLKKEGKSVEEIQAATGLSYSSVQGYLPHQSVYNLDTMSAECERIRIYRQRKKSVEELAAHLGKIDQSVYLWRTIIAFQAYPFSTAGRGIKFMYEVSKEGKAGGRHYEGENVDGYGNELWVVKDGQRAGKSIARSTVDLAFRNALEMEGNVKGPKALGVPGAGSYLYPLLIRFGVIKRFE